MKAQKIVDILNEAAALDPQATKNIITTRTSCNDALVSHRSIVCRESDGCFRASVSVLGFLQGLLDISRERIVAIIDDNPMKPIRFEVGTPETHPKSFE